MPTRPHATRWLPLLTALPLLAGLLLLPVAAASAAPTPAPVVLIGTGGVQWSDVSPEATPNLARLVQVGAIGDVTVRSVKPAACPVDGWLAVSAGRRAGDVRDPKAKDPAAQVCRAPEVNAGIAPGGSATVTTWPRYLAAAKAEKFDATPGLLGDALAKAGVCANAVGSGGAVALARHDGTVGRYTPNDSSNPADLGQVLSSSDCPLTVLDVGAVRDPANPLPGPPETGVAITSGDRAAQVRAVDEAVGRALDAVPDGARVFVLSLADSGATPHLQLGAATGPGYGPGWLWTSSTRQVALVQATDVTPTLLSLLGVPEPNTLVGSPITNRSVAAGQAPASADARLQKVEDLENAAQRVQKLVAPFFDGLVLAQLLLYGGVAIVLRHSWTAGSRRRRLLSLVRRTALVFACVPVSTYLANTVPWWRYQHALLMVVLAVACYVLALSLVAQLGPWRHRLLGPFGAVAGLTSVVLAADIVTGSRLQTSSLMGLQPVVAGRFYGFSNVAFALFATGAMLFAIAVADHFVQQERRRTAAVCVAVVGMVATALDVSPSWGSDFGGPMGLVPSFAILTLLVLGVRLSWRKIALIAAGTVLLLAAVSVVDWLRPADQQTHLGRFVQTVIDGGAWQVISRKGEQNLSILFGSVLSILVPVAALFVVLVLMRPSSVGAGALQRAYDRSPTLRQGLYCLLLLLGIGFAVNDSGTAIPAVGFTLAIPLIIAASVRALEDEERAAPAELAPATAPARSTEPTLGDSPA
ncbi:hypothetical protein ACPPVT_00405 [Angustibacter sp. McL0619]|uniref:hypothetical protein n=1 Tax=Angustibacter sp. McL0619 TaxID=3415676 RepID=UPI003CFA7A76